MTDLCDCCEAAPATTIAYQAGLCPDCFKAAKSRRQCRH